MTRILLHPHLLPRTGPTGGSRVQLVWPWRWWRVRILLHPEGWLFTTQYDDMVNIREASLLFNLEDDEEIIDPPAMHVTESAPEFDTLYGRFDRVLMTRGSSGECELVWYEQPGERWQELPGNTCHPGDYRVEQLDTPLRSSDDSMQRHYSSMIPPLRWWIPSGILLTEPPQIPRIPLGRVRLPAKPPRAKDAHPEDRVLDEIDRLVNAQIRVGPVDDYAVNRYPKCPHCPHDWHGLLCSLCSCLGDLEEEV